MASRISRHLRIRRGHSMPSSINYRLQDVQRRVLPQQACKVVREAFADPLDRKSVV